MNDDTIRNRLRHVYWMGGSPCAGKSTMAGLIAAAHGLTHYHIDQELRTRLPKPEPARQPCLAYWVSSTWDELWMRPVDVLLDDVIRCYQEQFDLVIADLLAMDAGAPILVEGNSLLPDSLAPFLFDRRRALWVIPTEAFQRRNYPNRGEWVQYILSQCSDPDQALQNWMDRDVAFAAWIEGRVKDLGLAHFTVDGVQSIEQNVQRVIDFFDFFDFFGLSGKPVSR